MKKEIHPGVIVAAVVVVLAIVGFLFYQNTATPPPQQMGAQGPGMAALKKSGGDLTKLMSPAEKEMMQKGRRGGGP